jgi:hypothetical protein
MPKSRNTYIKGLNQDNSRSKYDPANYYDALNIKVITGDGLSTGSIENEKGNKLSFLVPDTLEQTYTYVDGTSDTIPAQSNLRIIGWCSVANYVVLFTTTLTGGVGQVWAFKYNETDNTIVAPSGASLNAADHLVYNNNLNFSIDNRIEAEGRYENDSIIRVYWTDNNNQLRSINILDTATNNVTKPDGIDIKPNVTFSQPTVESIGVGNLPAGGKVQYAYRLISDQGAQTVVSPTSPLVPLTVANAATESEYVDIVGEEAGSSDTRSVTFNIKAIDRDYAIIEHIAVLYTVKDAPVIFKFGEEAITSDDVSITLSGEEPRIILTQAEFSIVTSGFEKCKTIDAKSNRLIVGNVSTTSAEITTATWDARAYRFNALASGREAKLYNSNGTTLEQTISGASPDWTVPENADAVNIFNNESPEATWSAAANQYKYKADGATLGGEGPNVSYTFVTVELEVDNKDGSTSTGYRRQNAPMYSADRVAVTENTGMTDPKGAAITLAYTDVFKNFSDPYIETLYTGYARGEVYRFGIEFYLKKGNTTFVKWIGDIKFPEPLDDVGYAVGNGAISSGKMNVKTIGIQFSVNINAIKDIIGGFRIVRAERPVPEMTKLGTGFILIVDKKEPDDAFGGSGKKMNTLYEAGAYAATGTYQVEVGIRKLKVDGGKKDNRFHLPDMPGLNLYSHGTLEGVHLEYTSTRRNTIFLSPLTIYKETNQFEFKEGDYIKVNGYYHSKAHMYQQNTGSSYNYEGQSWVWYTRTFELANYSYPVGFNYEVFKVDKVKYLEDGEYLPNSSSLINDSFGDGDFVNATYTLDSGASAGSTGPPMGIGNNIYFMTLEHDVAGTSFMQPASMGWNNNIISGSTEPHITAALGLSYDFRFKEVAWTRPLTLQYGGNSYEARSKQQYISTGHFQPITSLTNNTSPFTPRVFGGDTYVGYWGREYIQQYYDIAEQNGGPDGIYDGLGGTPRKLAVAAILPVESYVNTNLSRGRYFAKDREGDNVAAYAAETYNHDRVYRQQNNSENKFFAKDFSKTFTETFPHRLWASKAKVDGEPIDAWRTFKDANILDVEGSYGPVNKIINFQDKIYFYQDRALGIAAINERSVITDSSGVQLTLGTGDVLADFRYVSTTTGTIHQNSVVASNSSLYHYDVTLRKFYRINANGQQPVSDLKGLSSFFANNVDNQIVETDSTLANAGGIGIHGVFDHRNNRALFTFLSPKVDVSDFTISYNEMLDSFESFYSYVPRMYLNTGRRILSTDPNAQNLAYVHGEGRYGEFYGGLYPSHITLVVSPEADIPKIFTNIEYNSEVSLSDVQQPSETLNSLEIWNDYQTTGNIPLIVGTNVKRRLRHWRHVINRASNSSNQRARMRDYAVFMKLSYSNNNDKRLVLHDIIVSYTPSRD